MIPFIENTWQKPEAIIYMKLNSLPPREVEIEGVQIQWSGQESGFSIHTETLLHQCRDQVFSHVNGVRLHHSPCQRLKD